MADPTPNEIIWRPTPEVAARARIAHLMAGLGISRRRPAVQAASSLAMMLDVADAAPPGSPPAAELFDDLAGPGIVRRDLQ
jgi:hypothetical protein